MHIDSWGQVETDVGDEELVDIDLREKFENYKSRMKYSECVTVAIWNSLGVFLLCDDSVKYYCIGVEANIHSDCKFIDFIFGGVSDVYTYPLSNGTIVTDWNTGKTFDISLIKSHASSLWLNNRLRVLSMENTSCIMAGIIHANVPGVGDFKFSHETIHIKFIDTVVAIHKMHTTTVQFIDQLGESIIVNMDFPVGFQKYMLNLIQFLNYINKESLDRISMLNPSDILARNRRFLES